MSLRDGPIGFPMRNCVTVNEQASARSSARVFGTSFSNKATGVFRLLSSMLRNLSSACFLTFPRVDSVRGIPTRADLPCNSQSLATLGVIL